jgi:glucan 1,3-beta-glucosidase
MQCTTPCSGNAGEICGGTWRLGLYSYLTCNSTSLDPPAPGWKFKGCFTDSVSARTLSVQASVPGAMTVKLCQAACKRLGYVYAGVEYAVECCNSPSSLSLKIGGTLKKVTNSFPGCDNLLQHGGGPALDGSSGCNMPCSGNSSEVCGGGNRLDLYSYGS